LHQYETVFIVNPELDKSETNDVIDGVKGTIESGGGKILKVDPWGKKKLAYRVKRHNDGYYVFVVFESGPEFVRQLNGYYQITEPIIKHIVVRFEGDLTVPAQSHTKIPRGEETDEDSPGDSPFEDVESKDEDKYELIASKTRSE
jgi:small subunit ribosomal protein S6